MPGTAAPVKLKFLSPAGTIGSRLLPTGNALDVLEIPDYGKVEVSLVDAANPLVFVRAEDMGLTGKELPRELDSDSEKLELLEKLRGLAAVRLGLIWDYRNSAWESPGIPKTCFVTKSTDYTAADGTEIKAEEVDLLARMMSMQKTHPSYAMTGAMCTACAAVVPGSVVQRVLGKNADTSFIRNRPSGRHPSGRSGISGCSGRTCDPIRLWLSYRETFDGGKRKKSVERES